MARQTWPWRPLTRRRMWACQRLRTAKTGKLLSQKCRSDGSANDGFGRPARLNCWHRWSPSRGRTAWCGRLQTRCWIPQPLQQIRGPRRRPRALSAAPPPRRRVMTSARCSRLICGDGHACPRTHPPPATRTTATMMMMTPTMMMMPMLQVRGGLTLPVQRTGSVHDHSNGCPTQSQDGVNYSPRACHIRHLVFVGSMSRCVCNALSGVPCPVSRGTDAFRRESPAGCSRADVGRRRARAADAGRRRRQRCHRGRGLGPELPARYPAARAGGSGRHICNDWCRHADIPTQRYAADARWVLGRCIAGHVKGITG
eukprot:m.1260489 g.1260489  ORF g.1260489 m.1260489 type:complete len:313 (+) comp24727_c0_seq11:1251-2189(+)